MKVAPFSIIIGLLVLLMPRTSEAQIAKFSNEFLSIGVSADAMGMGKSVAASVDDATAIFWNPAGLTSQPDKYQVAFMHSEYFAGIAKYDFGAFSVMLDSNKHAFGMGFVRFAVDDIPNTLDLVDPSGNIDYDKVTSFSVGDYAIYMSYSRHIIKGLNVGGSVKIITRRAGDINVDAGFSAKSWGFGIDLGAIYTHKDWKFGLHLKDITTTFNAWSFEFTEAAKETFLETGNIIPDNSQELTAPQIIIGIAYTNSWKDGKIELTAEVDFDISTDGKRPVLITGKPFSIDPHFGFELGFAGIVYGRAGINNIQKVLASDNEGTKISIQPNIGGGIKFRTFSVDYAFTDIGNVSEAGYSHVISAKVGLNLNKKTRNE